MQPAELAARPKEGQSVPVKASPMDTQRRDAVIKQLIAVEVNPELTATEKQTQYLRMREMDFYYRGIPNIALYTTPQGTLDYRPAGTPYAPGYVSDQDDADVYDYTVPLIQAYGRRYQAALGARPWYNCKPLPEDPKNEVDRQASRLHEVLVQWLARKWNLRQRNYEIPHHNYKDGTAFIHTPYIADRETWGTHEEPVFEEREEVVTPEMFKCPACGTMTPVEQVPSDQMTGLPYCQNCGGPLSERDRLPAETVKVPVQVGTKEYPNAGPAFQIYSGYEVSIPFDCKDVEKSPYLILDLDVYDAELLRLYGEKIRETRPEGNLGSVDSVTDTVGKLVRQARISPNGISTQGSTKRLAYRRIWLSPSMFEKVSGDTEREELTRLYPNGMKVTMVGDLIVKDPEPEAIAEVWTSIKPEVANYEYTDPYGYTVLQLQEIISTYWAISVAFGERKLPTVAGDPDLGLAAVMNARNSLPMEYIEVAPGFGKSIDSAFAVLPTAQGEASQYLPMIQYAEGLMQSVLGINAALWGEADSKTAEEARLKLQQALQQIAPNGEFMAQGYAKVFTKAIKAIIKHGKQNFTISGRTANGAPFSEVVDLPILREGRVYIEAEVGVPMSYAEKRTQLDGIIKENPQVASALDVDKPWNGAVVRDYLLPGFEELKIQMEDEVRWVDSLIEELSMAEPIPGPEGMEPSIKPDPFLLTPQMVGMVQQWARSEAGRRVQQEFAPGFQNVLMFGQYVQQATAPPPMAGPEGEPPPAEGPEGAPPQPPPEEGMA
jgi:hypothetical protein